MPEGNASALKQEVPGPSPEGERRRYRRHVSEQFTVTFLGATHQLVNWSLGGFLVPDRHPHTPLGTFVSGYLNDRVSKVRFRFSAEMVRRDARTQEIAFAFIKPSRALQEALQRMASQV